MSKVGIDQLKKIFIAAIAMGNACGIAYEDGTIGLGDMKELFAFGGAVKDMATEVDFKLAFPQFEDIDDDEMAELMELVEENFDIPEETIEDKVKQIFGLASRYYALVSETIDMIRHPEVMG